MPSQSCQLTTINGCDSTAVLNLTINNSTNGVDVQEHCDTYTWIDGVNYTSSNNTATHTLTNAAGCDSVITLDLIINNSDTSITNVTACESYQWNGEIYTESGTYEYQEQNDNGYSMSFDGVADYIDCGDFNEIDNLTSWSFQGDFLINSFSNTWGYDHRSIISEGSGNDPFGWSVLILNNQNINFYFNQNAVTLNYLLNENQW